MSSSIKLLLYVQVHFNHAAYLFHNFIATVKIFSVSFDIVFGIMNTFIQLYPFLII
jgi:hypothetical protein